MKLTLLSIAFWLVGLPLVQAQGSSGNDLLQRLRDKENEGSVILHIDSLVELNYQKHLLFNYRNRGISGFRIRIFSDNGPGAKENQQRTRARFLSLYPDVDVYYRYEGSYYKVYIGDFRTRNDAMKLLEDLKRNFPDAFIVEDHIVLNE